MNASTSRLGLRAAVKLSSRPCSRMRPVRLSSGRTQLVFGLDVRYSSSEPKRIGKGGKGKENERYNYNTSMSFSEDIDPDVSKFVLASAEQSSMSITAESRLPTSRVGENRPPR